MRIKDMMNWMKIFKRGIAVGIVFYFMIFALDFIIDSIGLLFITFNFSFLVCSYYSKYEWGVISFLTKKE